MKRTVKKKYILNNFIFINIKLHKLPWSKGQFVTKQNSATDHKLEKDAIIINYIDYNFLHILLSSHTRIL